MSVPFDIGYVYHRAESLESQGIFAINRYLVYKEYMEQE